MVVSLVGSGIAFFVARRWLLELRDG